MLHHGHAHCLGQLRRYSHTHAATCTSESRVCIRVALLVQALHRDIAGLQHERDWVMHEKARHLQQQEQHYMGEVHQLQTNLEQLQQQLQASLAALVRASW